MARLADLGEIAKDSPLREFLQDVGFTVYENKDALKSGKQRVQAHQQQPKQKPKRKRTQP